jgi:hypothetical protein
MLGIPYSRPQIGVFWETTPKRSDMWGRASSVSCALAREHTGKKRNSSSRQLHPYGGTKNPPTNGYDFDPFGVLAHVINCRNFGFDWPRSFCCAVG